MANICELLSKNGIITPEKARKSRQMQFRDKTAYVWGLRYRWAPFAGSRTLCHPGEIKESFLIREIKESLKRHPEDLLYDLRWTEMN